MLFTCRRRCETRFFEQILATHEFRELHPPTVAEIRYPQGEISVADRDRLVANFDADKVLVKLADHETEQRFLHRHDDSLALAGALASVERSQDAAHHADARCFVADADSFGSRRTAVIPPGVRPAGHTVVGVRRAAVVLVRSRLAEAA